MDDSTDTQQPDPAVLSAQLQEANSLIGYLRERTALLNMEVRVRDARLAALASEDDPAESDDAATAVTPGRTVGT